MKRRAIATILSVMMLLSLLTAYPAVMSVSAEGETQTITATAEDIYGSGSVANMTITAPTTVVVGETFEVIYQFHDYVTSTGNPGCFVIDTTIDTNYVTLHPDMGEADYADMIQEPTTVFWELCSNPGEAATIGGSGRHNISYVTIEEDPATADTLTVKVKYVANATGAALFDMNFVDFADAWDMENYQFLPDDFTVNIVELSYHTVTFFDMDGNQIGEPQSVKDGEDAVAPTAPEVEGYTFTQWDKDFTNVTSDLEVTAKYDKLSYEVKFFDMDDNQIGETQTVYYGDDAVAPTAPEVEGHTFIAWDNDYTNVTSNLDVKALYDRLSYEVKFYDMDGNQIGDTQTVYYGEDAVAPVAPEVEGYTFTQWDKDFTNVTSNLDVRATYDRLSYEVKFFDMNGNQIGDTQTVYYGEDAVAPTAPEVVGYTFDKWDADYTNVTADLEVNALYNIIKCTVTFNLGDYGTTTDQYTWEVDYNTASSAIIAPTVIPTSAEYTFTGWDDTLPEFITEDITINALYEVPTFEVKFFDMDGNQIGDTQVINYGQDAVAPAAPEVEGYAFTGWDTVYTNVTSNLAVNAKYERLSYEVKFFDMDGNQIGETQTVYYGENAVAPQAPEVEGYTFDKWDTAYINVTSNLEVNALYNRLSYEVKFFDMDGNQIGEAQTVYYGEDAVAPAAPEVEGYTFIEWDAVYTNVTADLEVNATYERLSYEVKFFDKDGNQIGETQTVYYGEDAVAPAAPEVEGYTFDKWDTAYINVTSNLEVNALYNRLSYEVKFFDMDGNQIGETQTVYYGEDAVAPAAPEVEGYTFDKWDVVYTDVTADLEVNALYNIKQYTVTFVVGENGTTDDQLVWVVDYNTASSEITVPVVETVGEAYTFSGWDKDLPDFITEDITLNAIINLDGEITISFAAGDNGVIFHVDNGDTVVGDYSITVQAGQVASEAFTLPYVLANDGYMFDGWYVGDALFDDTAVLDSSITLTAKFVERVISITDASVEVGNTYATVTLTVNANTADFADRLYVFSQYTTGVTNIAINAVNPVEVSEGVYTLTFNVVKTNVDSIDVYLTNGAINFAAETWNVEAIYSGISLN